MHRAGWVCAIALVLCACDRKAEGQTIAVVNGEEITASELNAELERANIPPGEASEKARGRILQTIVNRELLTQQAREAGIDKSPEFITQQRQLIDGLLINMLLSRQLDTAELPSSGEIRKFEDSHPQMFAGREIWTLQQIQYPTPSSAAVKKKIEETKTLDELIKVLNGSGIKFTRGTNRVDTSNFPEQIYKQVSGLPQGEPFLIATDDRTVASAISAREPAPRSGEEARGAALAAIRKAKADEVLKSRLEKAKKAAEITYQPGFEPSPE